MQGNTPEVAFGNLMSICDENVVLDDGHTETQAGVHKENHHEDVIEDSVAICVGAAA